MLKFSNVFRLSHRYWRVKGFLDRARAFFFRAGDGEALISYRAVAANLSDRDVDERRSGTPGQLEEIFYRHKGRSVRKWSHYLPVYDELFSAYRGTDVHFLELGVNEGGSLEIWREYFGPKAVIYGIDVNPECSGRVDKPNQVRIGSQDDPDFLDSVLGEMGRIDIVLDDGSHVAEHQIASFKHLFPPLMEGGLYAIEDVHTSYWARGGYNGGYRRNGTAIEMVKDLIDDMHGWYHSKGGRRAPCEHIDAVLTFDSIVGIRKKKRSLPGIVERPK